jgi:hypothetical protein
VEPPFPPNKDNIVGTFEWILLGVLVLGLGWALIHHIREDDE